MNNKVLYIICCIAMAISLTQCAPAITKQYVNKENNQVMERINVNALLKAENLKTTEKTVVVNKDYMPDGRLRKLDYYEEDHKTGRNTIIYWSRARLDKRVYTIDSSIAHIYNFYSDGSLKYKSDRYVGKVSKGKGSFVLSYGFNYNVRIGKEYLYDQDGNIEKVIDYDAKFPFSIEQVLRLMKEKYDANIEDMVIRQRGSGVRNFDTEQPYWEVIYGSSEKRGAWLLHIDGKTGEVTEKGLFIVHP